jgi:sugar/nucleoside kinase (ribokinase family)
MSDIIGIGNAISDILIKVDDDFFDKIPYEKSSMSLISYDEANQLLNLVTSNEYKYSISSGGSVANSIALLSQLDVKTSLIGNVSDDYYGKRFTKDIEDSGVKFTNLHNNQDKNSAKCIVLVSNDGERTLCTYLGCSSFLRFDNDKSSENLMDKAKYSYLEGYILDNELTKQEILTLLKSTNDTKFILSLSDKGCVQRNRSIINELVSSYTDTVIGNESEFSELLNLDELNKDNVNAAAKLLADNASLNNIIITLNKNGAFYINSDGVSYIETEQITPYDSTGAGDAFAAGYLYGVINNINPIKSCKIGHLLAGNVIQHLGARPNIEVTVINEQIQKIA